MITKAQKAYLLGVLGGIFLSVVIGGAVASDFTCTPIANQQATNDKE
jgi:uncharacterized membrane protein